MVLPAGRRAARGRQAGLLAAASIVLLVLNLRTPLREDREAVIVAPAAAGQGAGAEVEALRGPADAHCETEQVRDLWRDPCYALENRARVRQCHCRDPLGGRVSLSLPEAHGVMNKSVVEREMLLVFVHVNKAGGSTIKNDVLLPGLARNRWDGAALGMFKAWAGLGPPWAPPERRLSPPSPPLPSLAPGSLSGEPLLVRCGKQVAPPRLGGFEAALEDSGCPLRAVWGSMSLGLCQHFPGRPCMQLVVLREPLARAVSNYNYVCVEGAEGRKKWRPEWRRAGRCPLTLEEFFREDELGEPDFLLWRLTRGCDGRCGVAAAVRNLRNPCVRFLLLERMDDGLRRLADLLGEPYQAVIGEALRTRATANKAAYHRRIKEQLADEDTIRAVRARLRNDEAIYKAALDLYEQQWDQPLRSCNQFLP